MYAIMLKDEDCIGLVSEPFRNLQDVYDFINEHELTHMYGSLYILKPYSVVSSVKCDDGKDFLLTEVI